MGEQIILIGYRATGKTSVGKRLAARLALPFVDLDHELESRQGCRIAQLVATHGWPYFRGLEREMLMELMGGHDQVISTGGGAILHQDIWPELKATGLVVWLTAREETICQRLRGDARSKSQRPALTGGDICAEIAEVLKEREPLYRAGSHCVVDTTTLGLEEIVEHILGARVQVKPRQREAPL